MTTDNQANKELTNSSLQDLTNDLDSIYNTYALKSNTESVETLDSNKDQVSEFRVNRTNVGHSQLPAVHISSRLSSLDIADHYVIRSAPETPNSGSSFDFTPHTQHHQALTNSSLNVLLDTQTTGDGLKDLVAYPSEIQLTSAEESNIDDRHLDENDRKDDGDWNEKGAAIKKIDIGKSNYRIIKRTVQDFKFGRGLGEGSYSTVVLATDKHTSTQYAVKILDKRHIIKEKKVKYVNIEKQALNRLSNRMGIISLYFTFQDKTSLYFVLDYASKGELLSLIKNYNSLNEECTRHFGAQILDAIKYMHDNGVIHRDIKPENILLDDKLRIQITDFGTARLLEKKNGESEEYPVDVRAKSFVGTAEYVSPELLENKYCGKPGDIWAFGCILYQMIAGKPPFKAPNEYLTFQKITKLQYAFSAGFPMVVRDLIKQILVLQPSKRATIPVIQNHYFFQSINFDDHESIWSAEPPELGPYKMNAKSMMKVPELTKSPSQPQMVTKKLLKKSVNGSSSDHNINKGTNESNGTQVNPASAAAFVLNKKETPSQTSINDNEIDPENDYELPKNPSRPNNSAGSSRAPAPDYIPGTNILRPTISTRTSYSRTTTTQRKKGSKPKSKILDVTPLSSLETAWANFLNHEDERILKTGPVIVHKEPTELFEKRYKGSLHNSPLGFINQLQALNTSSRGGTSFLSQVVNGSSNGLRDSIPAHEDLEYDDDETEVIIDYFEIEETQKDPSFSAQPESSESNTSGKMHRSIFKKLLSYGDKSSKENVSPDSSSSNSRLSPLSRQHPLDKLRTCTMIVTTLGRALILFRNDGESKYRLINEIRLNYPFIQFKEVVTSSSKFQKLLPTIGIFAITSSHNTFVFEVEKYEVAQWTEALAKSKLNQFERDRVELEHPSAPRTSESASSGPSPKLMDSPVFNNYTNSSGHRRSSSNGYRVDQSAHTERKSAPSTPSNRAPPDSKQRHNLMASKLRSSIKRKRPPPIKSANNLDMSTGLSSSASHDNGTLHAAQLAISNNAYNASTQNRRSSFTRDDTHKSTHPVRSKKSPPNNKQAITSLNSKFLARSQRKK